MAVEVDGAEYFRLIEVARLARISRQTLWRWRRDGVIPVGRLYRGHQVLFTAAETDAVRDYANRIELLADPEEGQFALFAVGGSWKTKGTS